jgi:hypothetical protein
MTNGGFTVRYMKEKIMIDNQKLQQLAEIAPESLGIFYYGEEGGFIDLSHHDCLLAADGKEYPKACFGLLRALWDTNGVGSVSIKLTSGDKAKIEVLSKEVDGFVNELNFQTSFVNTRKVEHIGETLTDVVVNACIDVWAHHSDK